MSERSRMTKSERVALDLEDAQLVLDQLELEAEQLAKRIEGQRGKVERLHERLAEERAAEAAEVLPADL